jgi:hypothetical protein
MTRRIVSFSIALCLLTPHAFAGTLNITLSPPAVAAGQTGTANLYVATDAGFGLV